MNTKIFDNAIEKPIFGEFVFIKKYLVKKYSQNINKRIWEEKEFNIPVRALCIGFRTIRNGRVHYEDNYRYFEGEEQIKTALFVIDKYKNPIYVAIK